jgi:hypothetical protein
MAQGFPGGGGPPQNGLQQVVAQLRAEFGEAFNRHAGWMRGQIKENVDAVDKRLAQLEKISAALVATRSGGDGAVNWGERGQKSGIVRIEDIPGRRVPYDFIVDIPIGNNTTSIQQQSLTVSQEGPFVAVKRVATFQSAYQFNVTSGNAQAKFSGRSFGRYRPIHSAWDLNDASQANGFDQAAFFMAGLTGIAGTFPALPAPLNGLIPVAVPALASAASAFRTMEFDGRIQVINAGSSYPRQNISVPSSLWTPEINAPQDLGALDFFERGEVLTIAVQPNHVNNPPFGNIDGGAIAGQPGAYPFLAGQYDVHEGIAPPVGPAATPVGPWAFTTFPRTGNLTFSTTENVQRLPDGILTIGWIGYRIIQPVGPA